MLTYQVVWILYNFQQILPGINSINRSSGLICLTVPFLWLHCYMISYSIAFLSIFFPPAPSASSGERAGIFLIIFRAQSPVPRTGQPAHDARGSQHSFGERSRMVVQNKDNLLILECTASCYSTPGLLPSRIC